MSGRQKVRPRPDLVQLAIQNDSAHRVTELLGNAPIDLDWDTLYRIYENIRNDVSDRGEMAELFDGKRQCSRFAHTANYAARHEGWDTPPNPMDISEARKLVLNAAAKWVRSKV